MVVWSTGLTRLARALGSVVGRWVVHVLVAAILSFLSLLARWRRWVLAFVAWRGVRSRRTFAERPTAPRASAMPAAAMVRPAGEAPSPRAALAVFVRRVAIAGAVEEGVLGALVLEVGDEVPEGS